MNIKHLLAGLVLTLLISPTVSFAQTSQPPGLPAVDFGDEEVPEVQVDNTNTPQEEENIGEPPSLQIDTGNSTDPTPPVITIDPTPTPDPNPNPAPNPNPNPINPPVTPDTGPGMLLSLIPALGYSLNKRFNKQ